MFVRLEGDDAIQAFRGTGDGLGALSWSFSLADRYALLLLPVTLVLAGAAWFLEHLLDGDPASNVIEVYINRLRRKLGKDLIATRRGQGYIFGDTS